MNLDRINKLRESFKDCGIEGLYVTNLTNVRYLTGFTGSAGSVLVLENEAHFFTDGRYTEQVKDQVKNSKIHIEIIIDQECCTKITDRPVTRCKKY